MGSLLSGPKAPAPDPELAKQKAEQLVVETANKLGYVTIEGDWITINQKETERLLVICMETNRYKVMTWKISQVIDVK